MKKFIISFIKENKGYFIASFLLLLFFIGLYIFLPVDENIKNYMMKQMMEKVNTIGMYHNKFILAWNLFINNLLVAVFMLISGFVFSLLAVLALLGNVYIVGIVFSIAIQKIGLLKTILGVLPHGLFEITAILFSVALAFKITVTTTKKVWNYKKYVFIQPIKESFKFFVLVVVPLLLLAAFVEAFITPLFLR